MSFSGPWLELPAGTVGGARYAAGSSGRSNIRRFDPRCALDQGSLQPVGDGFRVSALTHARRETPRFRTPERLERRAPVHDLGGPGSQPAACGARLEPKTEDDCPGRVSLSLYGQVGPSDTSSKESRNALALALPRAYSVPSAPSASQAKAMRPLMANLISPVMEAWLPLADAL